MRRMITAFAVAALCAFAGAPSQAETPLRARSWSFRVLLDGREIGQHRYTVAPNGHTLEVRSQAQFDVWVMFIDAYRYRHEAFERWDAGCLQSLQSHTVTNGEREDVSATVVDGRLVIEHASARDAHAGCIRTFAYWDPRILAEHQLLNSQTGELLPVSVSVQGDETLNVLGQVRVAKRHRITGPKLQIDVWYAGDDWVALEALAQGGRRIRYELM